MFSAGRKCHRPNEINMHIRERTVVICRYAKCDMHLEVLAAFKALTKISQNPLGESSRHGSNLTILTLCSVQNATQTNTPTGPGFPLHT